MEDEFKTKLKETLETMDTRLRQIEHLVNDVIIGSLESAANEYADNEAYNSFKSNYGESLKDLVEPYKKLFGEDYDLERNLYDDLKATEGYGTPEFDEKSCMEARIADLKARIDSLKETVEEVVEAKEEEPKKEEPKEEEITEEQLAKELRDAMSEGGF
jgi:hypothetical protein